ncbi:hypothetical protein TrCOL_g6366 [Triparma columacea]|uniref:COMM domain-containing protein n=1 Tax=Triparma columacea TaxID=722753 RepID=A0A9W7G4F2_9STRA|nr:hypothetical protein TrCOL_g6366 [Triparma columacea]
MSEANTSGVAQLKDFDYSVNVSVSSDKVLSMRTPSVSLSLTLSDPDGTSRQEVVEMNRDELEKVLKEMQKIEDETLKLTAGGSGS